MNNYRLKLFLIYLILPPIVLNASWVSKSVHEAESTSSHCDIEIDKNDNIHVAGYYDGNMAYFNYSNGSWTPSLIHTTQSSGVSDFLVVDNNQNIHVTHTNRGTAICYSTFDGSNWITDYIDSAGQGNGRYNAIAVDTNTLPVLIYENWQNGDYFKCAQYDGVNWSTSVIIASQIFFCDMVIDENNNYHISFELDQSLYYAKYDGISWSTFTIDNGISAGSNKEIESSIAIDSSNNPHISYPSDKLGLLKYAKYDGISWSTFTIDSSEDVYRRHTSIAIDNADKVHIAYSDITKRRVKYAYFNGNTWTVENIAENIYIDGIDIAIDSKREPNIVANIRDRGLIYFTKDTNSPPTIAATAEEAVNIGEASLSWIVPADLSNGIVNLGELKYYIVKYSLNDITTDSEFNNAIEYSQSWIPEEPGATENHTIIGLTGGTTYYFSIKAVDSVDNVSSLAPSMSCYVKGAIVSSKARCFPNPFKPASGHTEITFTGLTVIGTNIEIFSTEGELIKELEVNDINGKYEWDVKNNDGQVLASGLYFYTIKFNNKIKKGVFAVVR